MKELIEEVMNVVDHEYGRASDKFGLVNNSDHESYAIILEEVEESTAEVDHMKSYLSKLWVDTKCNLSDSVKLHDCKQLEHDAILAACELIQVAAMAKKASITILSRSEGGSV